MKHWVALDFIITYKHPTHKEQPLARDVSHVKWIGQQDEEIAYGEGNDHEEHCPLRTLSVHHVATNKS